MDERTGTTACYRHPERATRLRCSQCDKPICTDCSRDAVVGQKCPECAAPEGRYRVVQARTTIGRPSFATAPVSFSIITICVAVFLLGFLSGPTQNELIARFASVNVLIAEGEWWRIFTATFLHGSLAHIFFNMYALYLFGPRLEIQVGSVPYALLYFASAAGGGAASYLLGPEAQVAVGASGAIFGLLGAWMVAAYKMRRSPAGRAMFNQLAVLLAINMALPLLIPNIDWRAHLGGFAAGVLIAALWSNFAVGRPNAQTIRTTIAGATLAALVILVMVG